MDPLAQRVERIRRKAIEANQEAVGRIEGLEQLGFAQPERVSTPESTSLGGWNHLATKGPGIILPKGLWIIFYGAEITTASSAASAGQMAPAVNGNGPVSTDELTLGLLLTGSTGIVKGTVSRITVKQFNEDNNTVVLKYGSQNGNSVTFAHRWIAAVRIA